MMEIKTDEIIVNVDRKLNLCDEQFIMATTYMMQAVLYAGQSAKAKKLMGPVLEALRKDMDE